MTVIEKKFSRIVNGEHVDVMEIEPFQRNAPEYKCCLHKIHYTKGAFLVALLTLLISVIGIVLCFLTNYWFFFVPFVLFIIFAIFVLLAHKTEKKQFYLPYVIGMAILIVAAFLFVILCIVLIIWVPNWSQDLAANVQNKVYKTEGPPEELDQQEQEKQRKIDESRIFYAVAIIALLIFIVVGSWFTWVVYKAYNFLRDLHIARNPKRFIMELKTHHGIDEIEKTPKLPRTVEVDGEPY